MSYMDKWMLVARFNRFARRLGCSRITATETREMTRADVLARLRPHTREIRKLSREADAKADRWLDRHSWGHTL